VGELATAIAAAVVVVGQEQLMALPHSPVAMVEMAMA
jgi:hypothetical protein